MEPSFIAGSTAILWASAIAAVLFVLGLRGLSHPRTAFRGLWMITIGLGILTFATIWTGGFDVLLFFMAAALGGSAGAIFGEKANLRSASILIAASIGFGGFAAACVAGAALRDQMSFASDPFTAQVIGYGTIAITRIGVSLGILFGMMALGAAASLCSILQAEIAHRPRPDLFPAWGVKAFGVGALLAGILFAIRPPGAGVYLVLAVFAFLFGLYLGQSIRAETPVTLALLNFGTGAGVLSAGFALPHNGLLMAGAITASASLVFAQVLCRGMGLRLSDVLGNAFRGDGRDGAEEGSARPIRTTSAEEVAMVLDGARRVVLVPGYGLALSQGQHTLRDLANLLRDRGASVDYAIHPVAGCMPGQMNLLLTEADVPYEEMKEAEVIESGLAQTDVALVVGACDIVNPEARNDPKSPLAGLESLSVGRAETVVVLKRTTGPGFSGASNPLFSAENTLMLLGDAKKSLQELVRAVKENGK
jgi:NAD(P) transhydrogenase subunit beta